MQNFISPSGSLLKKSGYEAYKMNMKRKYRDVLAETYFLLTPKDSEIASLPIQVHFENLKQRLHTDETFQISTANKKTQIEGPEKAEAIYPQKLGM